MVYWGIDRDGGAENCIAAGAPLRSAGMMELADMRDLGSRAAMRWGSSPHARTMIS